MTPSVFRPNLYADKVVFITGGSSGINFGLAEAFGAAGAKVAINGRNVGKLNDAVAKLHQQGVFAAGYAADVREYDRVSQAMRTVRDTWGPIDVLVCGAAGNFPAPAVGMSANAFKSVVDIDLLGTFNACRAAFEHLRKPGSCVLNISAPQASQPMAMQAHVCAAKAGVDMLTRTLAMEWGGVGVRINSIVPGPIDETEGMARLAQDPAIKEKLRSLLPLQRMGTKDDVAQMALFLASPAASYVTGGIFPVDGGQMVLGGGLLTQTLMGQ